MVRIAGVDLSDDKRMEVALTYIYGIGRTSAQQILDKASVDRSARARDMDDAKLVQIRQIIEDDYLVEGDLKKEVVLNIKSLMNLGNYRGLRHRKGLPVRGQRTKTNARTRKGPKKNMVRR